METKNSWSILVLHEGATSTLRILERGFNYLKNVHGVNFRIVEFKQTSKISVRPNEIPFFLRCASPWSASFSQQLSNEGKPFVYFIDDDFLSLDISTPLGKHYRQPLIYSSILEILKNANLVLLNSEVLAERLKKFTDNVHFIPGFFDFSLLGGQKKSRKLTTSSSADICIGFASNHSRGKDLKSVEKALQMVLDEYFNCKIEIIGLSLPNLANHDRVKIFPHQDSYEKYITFQLSRNWDIAIAPLQINKQNKAKTNNKFREYGAMSIPGIYTDIEPYAEVVPYETGILVGQNHNEWVSALSALIENSELRRKIRNNAFEHVNRSYNIPVVMKQWIDEIEKVAQHSNGNTVSWNRKGFHSTASKTYVFWYVFRTNSPLRALKYFAWGRFR